MNQRVDDAAKTPQQSLAALRKQQTQLLWLDPPARASAASFIARIDRLERHLDACGEAAARLLTALEAESSTDRTDDHPPTGQATGSSPATGASKAVRRGGLTLAFELDALTSELELFLADPGGPERLSQLERRIAGSANSLSEVCKTHGITAPAHLEQRADTAHADSIPPRRPWQPASAQAPPSGDTADRERGQAAPESATRPWQGTAPGHPQGTQPPADAPAAAAAPPGPWQVHQHDVSPQLDEDFVQGPSRRRDPILWLGLLVLAAAGAGWGGALWWDDRGPTPPAPPLSRGEAPRAPQDPAADGPAEHRSADEAPASDEQDDDEPSFRELAARQSALTRRVEILEALLRETVAMSRASAANLAARLSDEVEPTEIDLTQGAPSKPRSPPAGASLEEPGQGSDLETPPRAATNGAKTKERSHRGAAEAPRAGDTDGAATASGEPETGDANGPPDPGADRGDPAVRPTRDVVLEERHYTVQLASVRSEAAALQFARRHGLAEDAHYFRPTGPSKGWFIIVQGLFDAFGTAEEARLQLPSSLRDNAPRVRLLTAGIRLTPVPTLRAAQDGSGP